MLSAFRWVVVRARICKISARTFPRIDQTAVGRLSRIDSLQNQGLTRNLQEREQAKLGQVVSAFQRMEEGRYGVCVECGGDIPFGRLQVFPETPTCTACSPT